MGVSIKKFDLLLTCKTWRSKNFNHTEKKTFFFLFLRLVKTSKTKYEAVHLKYWMWIVFVNILDINLILCTRSNTIKKISKNVAVLLTDTDLILQNWGSMKIKMLKKMLF